MIRHRSDHGSRRRLVPLAGIVVLLLASLGALGGTPAYAEENSGVPHTLEETIHGSELPQGAFHAIIGIAVDNSNGPSAGDLYVYEAEEERGQGRIDKFNGEGKYLGVQITGSATPQGSLMPLRKADNGKFSGIAVDDSGSPNKGDVYVGDFEHGVVDKFSGSGVFLCQITAKPPASRTTKEAEHECDGVPGSETPQGSIEPTGVAVDSSGDVYVADRGNKVIDEFSPSGAYMKQIELSSDPDAQEEESALSVAPNGDIYMLEYGHDTVKLSQTGTFLSALGQEEPPGSSGHEPTAMSVDPNGHVYTVDTKPPPAYIDEYGGNEELLATFGSEQFSRLYSTAAGLAVSHATGNLFVAEQREDEEPGAAIYVFSPDLGSGEPVIRSESSQNTTATGSELSARIEPSDLATTCRLQYVDEEQFEVSGWGAATTVDCTTESLQKESFAVSTASVPLGGLLRDTTYHYRFIVENSAAPPSGVTGSEETFTTFGVQSFSVSAFGPVVGEVDALAGSHPYELTTTISFPTTTVPHRSDAAEANPRNIEVQLPPGLIGNPDAVAKCSPYNVAHDDCSGASQVGVLTVITAEGNVTESPIYNLVPPKGVAAQFGARFNGYVTAHIDAKVRTGGGYGVEADSLYASSAEGLISATVTLWGVPSAESHDSERYCPVPGAGFEGLSCEERGPAVPFLSNPTSCTSSRATSVRVDSWQEPDAFVTASGEMPAITGCGKVDFKPSMVVAPTSRASDSSSGLDVELKVPQNEDPTGLAEADLKDAKVTLPPGVTVNPSSANGLAACPLLSGKEAHAGQSGIDLENAEPANCPEASKIGKVTIKSPLLEEELTGGVYVAQQNANPFKSLLALYIAVEAPERGIVVKLAGHVELNPTTGQLTTTFDENPQLPFETLKLDFFGGERGSLATPRTCGSYQPTALLEPFSHQGASGEEGTPDAEPYIEPFAITSGPNGSACGGSSFTPSFTAGSSSPVAGAYSPFELSFSREDGEQELSGLQVKMPLGLVGKLAGVAECSGAQIAAAEHSTGTAEQADPSCPAASEVGTVEVGAGTGSSPFFLPGRVYLTGSYENAPYGLAVVVPVLAGPFDLGTVVVRSRIEINPHTAQVTVTSDPFPQILDGIPPRMRRVDVHISRPEFTLNPTNCQAANVTGTLTSASGTQHPVSSRFQIDDCGSLSFKPGFRVFTHAAHTRRYGAYLRVKVTSGKGQANIKSVHVELPKLLPSRVETLKLACSAKQFAENPAGCPADSHVGMAVAHTPILGAPLMGSAIFVSHGGAAFPDLDVVLQGDGVTVDLEGNTNIVKGITSSDFKSVPDVPVSSFELTLPQGKDSALAATGNLCFQTVRSHKHNLRKRRKLLMPTTITGQNGAQIKQSTVISVSGCGKAAGKPHKKKKK